MCQPSVVDACYVTLKRVMCEGSLQDMSKICPCSQAVHSVACVLFDVSVRKCFAKHSMDSCREILLLLLVEIIWLLHTGRFRTLANLVCIKGL